MSLLDRQIHFDDTPLKLSAFAPDSERIEALQSERDHLARRLKAAHHFIAFISSITGCQIVFQDDEPNRVWLNVQVTMGGKTFKSVIPKQDLIEEATCGDRMIRLVGNARTFFGLDKVEETPVE